MARYDDINDIDQPTFEVASRFGARETTLQTIEMQESPTPPVHANPNVITMQPQGDVRCQRRPIPINSMDWVSTPRSQFSALSGTDFLGGVEQLEIQQIVDLSTLLGRSERGFQYRVKVPRAETLFLAMESRGENRPSMLGCSRFLRADFTLNIIDQCGETVFVMKINSTWTYALSKLHKITVGSSNLIGTVEENFTLLGPSFTIYDERRRELCYIEGPNICGCCMYQDAQFQVISMDGTHQIASLIHQWDSSQMDYTLLVTFPVETDIKLKGLLIGAAFLLEYLYFERTGKPTRRA